jgi:colanic acid/amylovoran biosynthesis glycosyltransferase
LIPDKAAARVAGEIAVAIVKHRPLSLTETFIRAHAEKLPARVRLIDGLPLKAGSESRFDVEACSEMLRQARPDVVLAEYGKAGAHILESCRILSLPLVVHFHGVDAYHHDVLTQYGPVYKEMFAYSSRVIGVSRHMIATLQQLGADREKIAYVPYGVETSFFTPTVPSGNQLTFLSVARFAETKAPDLTIQAFCKALSSHPTARLRMIGDGPLLGECKTLTRRLGIESVVSFLGARRPVEVRNEMLRARAFVQHSVTTGKGDREGTPIAILEASACGLPVVSTRHAGIVDAVIERKTGLLGDERDVDQMSSHIAELCTNATLADNMGICGRSHIVSKYDIEQSIERLFEVLRAAVMEHRHRVAGT